MAKKRSLKSYLKLAKKQESSKSGEGSSSSAAAAAAASTEDHQIDDASQDASGAIRATKRTTSDERQQLTNESCFQTVGSRNSIAGDLSSGYHSTTTNTNGGGGSANQFYPASSYQRRQSMHHQGGAAEAHCSSAAAATATQIVGDSRLTSSGQQLVMVDDRGSGEKSHMMMWPVMIDDELGSGLDESGAGNKVHLIDDDGAEADIVAESYADIDACTTGEQQADISDRFHQHRYCVDANTLSSPASRRRFDESFQLERQRHQQQRLAAAAAASNLSSSHHNNRQQYFHLQRQQQQQQQPASLQFASHFQPSTQQLSGLLNGPTSAFKASQQQRQQQQDKRFVSYIRQPPDIFGQLQYPIPPTNYSQQQYHTLVQYHPTQHFDHHSHRYAASSGAVASTSRSKRREPGSASTDSSAIGHSSDASNASEASNHQQYLQQHQQHHLNYFPHEQSHQHHHQLPSLTPSGAGGATTAIKMQPANSRQHLTAASDSRQHHQQQQQQQQQQHNKSGSRRKVQSSNYSSSSTSNQAKRNNKAAKPKPSLDCCGKLAKFLLFTANLLFWSAGIALGAWGILSLVEDHKYNLSQLLVFEPNSRMSLFQLLSWSFITLGCATTLVGFCGCSAIFKNNRWILGLYIFLVLAIFALDLATGLLAIIFQEKLVANVRLRLANKLRADYGVQASFTAAIDYIQTKFECCGLEGHFDYDQSVWRLQRLGGFEATVARTCCHLRNTFDDHAHINPRPVNESMCQSTDVRFHQSYRYRKGCLDDLERLVRHKIWTFTMGCAAVGGVILVSLMFATCFCRSIQSYSGSRKGSPAAIGDGEADSSSSPKQLESGSTSKSARHFTTTGNQISSQRHHHHHTNK